MAIWLIVLWTMIVLLVVFLKVIRRGSTLVKGDPSPGGGVELQVDIDHANRFPEARFDR
jgi:hypothetical protein